MTREMRLQIFERELERLLGSSVDYDYVGFSDARDPSRQVLFVVHLGGIYGRWHRPSARSRAPLAASGSHVQARRTRATGFPATPASSPAWPNCSSEPLSV